MAIWQQIRNSTPYRLYANDSPEGPFSNGGSGIPGIILGYENIPLSANNNDHNQNYILY